MLWNITYFEVNRRNNHWILLVSLFVRCKEIVFGQKNAETKAPTESAKKRYHTSQVAVYLPESVISHTAER